LSKKQVLELSHTSKFFEESPIFWRGIHTNKTCFYLEDFELRGVEKRANF